MKSNELSTNIGSLLNNCNNLSPIRDEQQIQEHHINNTTNANWNSDSWADGEFEPIEEPLTGNPKLDEARRKREEKKLQRQRELEARRAQKGPMKLGARKL
uniref:Uncharacterized protein n=1 Tax=Megaselia scalaris TaxID=36166 RepID=T1H455_MEGSC